MKTFAFDRVKMSSARKMRRISSSSEDNWDEDNGNELEEGEILDSDNDEVVKNNPNRKSHTEEFDSATSSSSSSSEFDDGYGEDLMGDEEDRKYLNGLTEIERETEIFRRAELRDLRRARWEIKRKLNFAKRDKSYDKKLKEGKQKRLQKKAKESHRNSKKCVQKKASEALIQQSEGSADSQPTANGDPLNEQSNGSMAVFGYKERSKERKKTVELNRTDNRSHAMALLKAKHVDKKSKLETGKKRGNNPESLVVGKSAGKLRTSEIYSDDSGSSDGDGNAKPLRKRSRLIKASNYSTSEWDDGETENQDPACINTRDELNKLRISRFQMERLINHPIFECVIMNCFVRINIGSKNMQAVYRVAEIAGVVETAKIYNLGQTRTNRGLRLKHGTQESVFRLEFISNQGFTASEFENWRYFCAKEQVPMPTLETLARKQLQIQEALNYEYKDEDVAKIIEEKKRFRKDPTNFALKKACLISERDAAIVRGDEDAAQDMSQQILELERRSAELAKNRGSKSSISYINNRNRKRNIEDTEKALMEEAHANKGRKTSDPFTRRITQPRIGFKPLDETNEFENPQSSAAVKDKEASGSEIANPKVPSLYEIHDFEIELDKTLPPATFGMANKLDKKANESAPKGSLNLGDYKKKYGLI